MNIFVNQKSIGKNKRVKTIPLEYKDVPANVYDLIENTVRIMVGDFYKRANMKESPLSEEQIRDLSEIGRVSFGIIYNDKMPDVNKAIETAVLAYRDGLVEIFVNDEIIEVESKEVTPTDEELKNCRINLKENDTITFIRLTMLAGRMW
ncbi:MAG: hypothetical protein J5856_00540 [Lachnospiraceae bacterium]|nr:hypothetical protein [Lachnospiraceae bacterium]